MNRFARLTYRLAMFAAVRRWNWLFQGKTWKVWLDTPMGAKMLARGADMGIVRSYFYHEYDYIKEVKRRIPNVNFMVDIGAHIGAVSLLLSNEKTRILAYEPQPDTFKILRKNLRHLNKYAYVVNKAISKQPTFSMYSSGRNHFLSYTEYPKPGQEIQCVAYGESMEQFYLRAGEGIIDILKIDCEGGEEYILKSLSPEFCKRIRCIIVETKRRDHWGDVFKQRGFDTFYSENQPDIIVMFQQTLI